MPGPDAGPGLVQLAFGDIHRSTAMAHSITHRVQRDGHGLLVVETRQDDGSHTFEIADGWAIVPFGVAVVYDPALPPPNQLKLNLPSRFRARVLVATRRALHRLSRLTLTRNIARYTILALTRPRANCP